MSYQEDCCPAAGSIRPSRSRSSDLRRGRKVLRIAPSPFAPGRCLTPEFAGTDRCAARSSPGFSAAAIVAPALGIGANTAIFSVLNAVILKPLPYPDPDRLVMFLNVSPQGSGGGSSPTKFNVWRRQTAAFDQVSAYRFSVVNITGDAEPEQVSAGYVSAGCFPLLGAATVHGRTFTAEEDRPGGGFPVVLSHGIWQRRFGGDAAVVGRTLTFNGQPHDIIGVLAPFDTTAIQSPVGAPEVWLPFQIDPSSTMQGNRDRLDRRCGRRRNGAARRT